MNATVSAKAVIRKFYVKLIRVLPLYDESFCDKAKKAGVLPSNVADRILAIQSDAEKVSYFLHHVVEPAADIYLPILLELMKDSQHFDVKKLANDIERAMTGMYIYAYIIIIIYIRLLTDQCIRMTKIKFIAKLITESFY